MSLAPNNPNPPSSPNLAAHASRFFQHSNHVWLPIRLFEWGLVIGAIVIGFGIGIIAFTHKPAPPSPVTGVGTEVPAATTPSVVPGTPAAPAATTAARHLDGVTVAVGEENHWPIGVMIENHVDARPQFGLSFARVVFEAQAEGGITRFLALFDGTEAVSRLGPVRSARHYYVSWAYGWNAMYIHAGGSPAGIALIHRLNVEGANGIGSMSRFFVRDPFRHAPHNLFTSMDSLRDIRRVKELEPKIPAYVPWTFSPEADAAARGGQSNAITLGFPGASYGVRWEYHPDLNRYFRFNGNGPQRDALTNGIIQATNLVVLRVGPVQALDGHDRIDFPTVGSGDMVLFRDGFSTLGKWKKESDAGMLRFYNADGSELALAPGITWIEALPTQLGMTY